LDGFGCAARIGICKAVIDKVKKPISDVRKEDATV
jgi:hypothetical protein